MQPTNVVDLSNPIPPREQAKGSGDILGREDFLRMLIAQLENQDPLSPQDPTEFTAQLAQFSTLEQLIAIRTSVEGSSAGSASDQLLSAAALIGRDVLAAGDRLAIDGSDAVSPIEVNLTESVSEARVEILDAGGRTVRRLELGALGFGRQTLAWDGRGDDGELLPAGTYVLRAEAFREGRALPIETLVRGRVTGALPASGESGPRLLLDGREASLSEVIEIREGGP